MTQSSKPDGRRSVWRKATALAGAAALALGVAVVAAPVASAGGSHHGGGGGQEPPPPYNYYCKEEGQPGSGDYHQNPISGIGNGLYKQNHENIIPPTASKPQGRNWNENYWPIWLDNCGNGWPEPNTASVMLSKEWVRGASGDMVALTISGNGVTNPQAGSSTVTNTIDATATATRGSSITLTEAFTADPSVSYSTVLECVVDNGAAQLIGVSNGSGTFAIPEGAASVNCLFTNTGPEPEPAITKHTVTVKKAWAGIEEGDNPSTYIWVKYPWNITKTSVTNSKVVTASYKSGEPVVFGETPKIGYSASWSCEPVESGNEWSKTGNFLGGFYKMPAFDVTCTITNTKKHREEPQEPTDTVTVYKQWYLDGSETPAEVPEGSVHPEGYDASFVVTYGDASEDASKEWGQPITIPGGSSVSVEEADVHLADEENCTYVSTISDGTEGHEPTFAPATFGNQPKPVQEGTDYVFTIKNVVTCSEPEEGGSTPSNPGTPPPPATPEEPEVTEPEVTEPQPETTEPEVAGESQEETTKPEKQDKPKVDVKGESKVEGAPSATAHTGESQNYGWAGLTLAAGLILLLGAARLRRENGAG